MKIVFALVAAAALAGCVSQTSVETRIVTDSVMADARRRAELRTQLASEYYQRGNFVVALEETRAAERSDPSYPQAYNVRGLVYMELREDAQARAAFERALGLAPNDPDIMNNFGWFLCLRGEAERGMAFFFALKPNEVSDVVKTPFGFHLIKLVDRKKGAALTLDQVKGQLQRRLIDERQGQRFQAWIKELEAGSKIARDESLLPVGKFGPEAPAAPAAPAEDPKAGGKS